MSREVIIILIQLLAVSVANAVLFMVTNNLSTGLPVAVGLAALGAMTLVVAGFPLASYAASCLAVAVAYLGAREIHRRATGAEMELRGIWGLSLHGWAQAPKLKRSIATQVVLGAFGGLALGQVFLGFMPLGGADRFTPSIMALVSLGLVWSLHRTRQADVEANKAMYERAFVAALKTDEALKKKWE